MGNVRPPVVEVDDRVLNRLARDGRALQLLPDVFRPLRDALDRAQNKGNRCQCARAVQAAQLSARRSLAHLAPRTADALREILGAGTLRVRVAEGNTVVTRNF